MSSPAHQEVANCARPTHENAPSPGSFRAASKQPGQRDGIRKSNSPHPTARAIRRLARYAVTASYLRPRQIPYRLKSILQRRLLHTLNSYGAWYARRATAAGRYRKLEFPDVQCEPVDLQRIGTGEFTFLNRTAQLGRPVNWFPDDQVRLWLYNLHYWHRATALGSAWAQDGDEQAYAVFRDQVRDWISSCPVATATAWDAYPTSLRLANWMRAYWLFAPRLKDDEAFATELRRSLYVQALFLEHHLEYDLLNNHLLENGRALLLAGLFFDGRDADRWRRKGERILLAGLEEDFTADGGHNERSPMYHQAMLELYDEVGTVLEANGYNVPQQLKNRLPELRSWLGDVCHPDGQIALFNDAVFSVVRPPREVLAGTEPTGDGLRALADSGYCTFRDRKNGHFLIFDCGPLGPDHQPGHGHCDTLSYELSVGGQRILVDSGVSTYHGDLDWRTYYRSTRAHNTVVVDGAEQSEIWHRFRVARRAKVIGPVTSDRDPNLLYASGSHTGYRRLQGSVVHRRWVCWVARRFWLVCDYLDGRGRHRVESFLHFHPEVTAVRGPAGRQGQRCGEVRRGDVTLRVHLWGETDVATYHGELSPIQGWYAPEFGLDQRNHVWSLAFEGNLPTWIGYVLWPEDAAPTVQSSFGDDGSCRITVQAGSDLYGIYLNQNGVTLETYK